MDGFTITRLIALVGVLVLAASAIAAHRPSWPNVVRYGVVWLALGAAVAIAYSLFQGR